VATSVGVIPEVLENGKTGFFVPPGDVEGLSAALFDLVKNEGKRKLFSDQAEKVAQRFDIKTTAREYENLYLSLLKGQ
jgi:glycosyltransferase involved in cell wall biosynthesis